MRDTWTALQFDSAVLTFGRAIENKLGIIEDGKPKYTLKELLADQPTEAERRAQTKVSLQLLKAAARKRGSGIQVN
jgi:hypothetical protein